MSNQAIVPKTRKSEMVWNKELGIYLLPKERNENEQPIVDINSDVIIAKAEAAYKDLCKERETTSFDPYSQAPIAWEAADCLPELLGLVTNLQNHVKILKEENEEHLIAREELWRQEAHNLAVMYEKENL